MVAAAIFLALVRHSPQVLGMLLRVSGKGVTIERTGEKPSVPTKFPVYLYPGMRVSVAKGSTAFIFDGNKLVPQGAGFWPAKEVRSSLGVELLEGFNSLTGQRKEYRLTGIRGSESALTAPALLAANSQPGTAGKKYLLVYGIGRSRASAVRIVASEETPVVLGTPKLIHSYEMNDVFLVEVESKEGPPIVSVDCGLIRGDFYKLDVVSEIGVGVLPSEPPTFSARLAAVDVLVVSGLRAQALALAYAASDAASDADERAQVDEMLWGLLRNAKSVLADSHLPKPPFKSGGG